MSDFSHTEPVLFVPGREKGDSSNGMGKNDVDGANNDVDEDKYNDRYNEDSKNTPSPIYFHPRADDVLSLTSLPSISSSRGTPNPAFSETPFLSLEQNRNLNWA